MFHTPLLDYTIYQAEAMEFKEVFVWRNVSGIKEKEVEELYEIMYSLKEERDYSVIVVGALASRYQYDRIKRIAEKLDCEIYAPGWNIDPEIYMRTLIDEDFKFIITRVSTMGLDPRIIGKIIDKELLEKIIFSSRKYGFHPAFEGGEAETLVVDAPHFKKRLCLKGRVKKRSMFNYDLFIDEIYLKRKNVTDQCIDVKYDF